MSIHVEHRYENGEKLLEWAQDMSNPALDDIWQEQWLRDGIGSRLTDLVKELSIPAGAFGFKCDRVVLVAEGAAADMLQAMLPLAPRKDKVLLLRSSLSAGVLSALIENLEGCSVGLIGVATEPETPAFCAVFATLRKLIADRYPEEKKARIKAVTGPRSTYLREEGERGDMEGFEIPASYDPGHDTGDRFYSEAAAGTGVACMATSAAMLYPMLVAGVDAGAYVRGFREMLSSPWWDQDADQYGLFMGSHIVGAWEAAEKLEEEILCWQPELSGVCRWIAAVRRQMGAGARALSMPGDEGLLRQEAKTTTIFCEEEAADIMLPAFPGVSPEGSMTQMAKEAAEALYRRTGGTMIRLKCLDAEELGRLAAYLQLSFGIAGWVPWNQ